MAKEEKLIEDFDSLFELMEYFKDEATCIKYLVSQRWKDGIHCPHCGMEKIYSFSDGKRYKCAACREQFTAKTGSIFEDTKISLRKWFIAVYFVNSHKKGISSHQLARDLKVTQKTAWFMLHRIRFALGQNDEEQLDGIIEVDETFVGGKNKNRHKDKKVENSQGRSFKDKTPVFGMTERAQYEIVERPHKVIPAKIVKEKVITKDSFVITRVVPDTKTASLQPIIKHHVKEGAAVVSDEWMAYNGLNKLYEHYVVDHGKKQYAIGDKTTNSMEGFWTWVKRAIIGIYHSVSRKHLQSYMDEITFRYNTKWEKEGHRVALFMQQVDGRLKYKTLIARA
jgi:transposase-like protein